MLCCALVTMTLRRILLVLILKSVAIQESKLLSSNVIRFDYRNLKFGHEFKELAWTIDSEEMNDTCLLNDEILNLEVHRNECSLDTPIHATELNIFETIKIPSENLTEGRELLYFDVVAMASNNFACDLTTLHFQLHPNESFIEIYTPLGDDVCLNVTNLEVKAVWPLTSPNEPEICACPLLCGGMNCLENDKYCPCISKTTYAVTFNTSSLKICWENITCDQNNTNIYLVTFSYPNMDRCPNVSFDKSAVIERFEAAYRIIIQDAQVCVNQQPTATTNSNKGLSPGAIAGIAIVSLIVLFILFYFFEGIILLISRCFFKIHRSRSENTRV